MSTELKKALYNLSALADLGQEITSESAFQEKMQAAFYVIWHVPGEQGGDPFL